MGVSEWESITHRTSYLTDLPILHLCEHPCISLPLVDFILIQDVGVDRFSATCHIRFITIRGGVAHPPPLGVVCMDVQDEGHASGHQLIE